MYPLKKFSIGDIKNIRACNHKSVGAPITFKYLINPFCVYVQYRIPACISPNTITWIGFFSMMTSFFAILCFDSNLTNPPKLLSLFNAIAIIIYIMADSIDGIHARNTNQSSPLGKVLDHFVDSFCVFAAWLSLCSALRLGYSTLSISFLYALLLGFYLAEIDEKYTGILTFSIISGCVEGLASISVIHLASLFNIPFLKDFFHSGDSLLLKSKLLIFHCGIAIYIISLVISVLSSFYNYQKKLPFKTVIFDLARVFYLVLLMAPVYYLAELSSFMRTAYLTTLAQSFSVCYLEDYISIMAKSEPDYRPFIISYLSITILAFLITTGLITSCCSMIFLMVTSIHFFGRAGSVLKSLSMFLNKKLF